MLRLPTIILLTLFIAKVHAAPVVSVITEEPVYNLVSPGNGAGPLWCYGCTQIVRIGDDVIVSQMETGKDVPLLCNTRWKLLSRTEKGWESFAEPEGYRQREPCPVGVTKDNGLFLYVNDSLTPPGTHYKECEPHLLNFASTDTGVVSTKLSPRWDEEQPYYTDHSYRGFGVDGPSNELIMLNIDAKTSIQHWCHLDTAGNTLANGAITFPIRSAYLQAALHNRSAHVLAISDIVEPIEEWRAYKFAQTQRKWDYVFRILYYTWTPDTTKTSFSKPIEIANVDKTGGYISNQDLWVAPDGSAYLMYREQEVQSALLRDKFMPGRSLTPSLHIAVVKDGTIVDRQVLIEGTETRSPGNARFHATPDGKLYALAYVAGANVLLQVYPRVEDRAPIPVDLKAPFTSFCLANTRAGCMPSSTIDIFGHTAGGGNVMAYAQLTFE
jgi:hypothetical protein